MGHTLCWGILYILSYFILIVIGKKENIPTLQVTNFLKIKSLVNGHTEIWVSFLIYKETSFYQRNEGNLSS